jgi:hypothetical protein
MKKRFFVFAYDHYYPQGGILDLKSTYDDYADAVKSVKALSLSFNVSYVLDIEANQLMVLLCEYAKYYNEVKFGIEEQIKVLADEN